MPTDPTVFLRDYLSDNWDVTEVVDRSGNQVLADKPELHTGWYSQGSRRPAITFTNKNEGPIRGGETGITATGTDGGTVQILSGYVLIDCVAGSRDDCIGVGPNGEDRNPKQVRWGLYQHTADLCRAYLPDDGDLHSLAPTDGLDIVDTDTEGSPAIYRTQFRASYTRMP